MDQEQSVEAQEQRGQQCIDPDLLQTRIVDAAQQAAMNATRVLREEECQKTDHTRSVQGS